MTEQKFDTWAIVEVMGHSRYAGHVTEQSIGGASFVRVDVPEIPQHLDRWGSPQPRSAAFTKLLGAGSIFAISPCTEEVARAAAKSFNSRPFDVFEIRQEMQAALPAPEPPPFYKVEDDEEFDDADVEEDAAPIPAEEALPVDERQIPTPNSAF